MEVAVARLDRVNYHFVQSLRTTTLDHVESVQTRVSLPINTVDLFEAEAFRSLEKVSDDRLRIFHAVDCFQTVDIARVEVCGSRRQLDRTRTHEHQFVSH